MYITHAFLYLLPYNDFTLLSLCSQYASAATTSHVKHHVGDYQIKHKNNSPNYIIKYKTLKFVVDYLLSNFSIWTSALASFKCSGRSLYGILCITCDWGIFVWGLFTSNAQIENFQYLLNYLKFMILFHPTIN